MIVDKLFIHELLAKAGESDRKRAYFDLRNREDEDSQRVLIAMLPGSASPIHRHPETSETIVVLKGQATELLYDENGNECGRNILCPKMGNYATLIPAGQWHTIIADKPCVMLETKAGCYKPVNPENVLSYNNRRFDALLTAEALQKELELAVQTNDIFALKMLVPKIAVSDVLSHPDLAPIYRQALAMLN